MSENNSCAGTGESSKHSPCHAGESSGCDGQAAVTTVNLVIVFNSNLIEMRCARIAEQTGVMTLAQESQREREKIF
jgi:hypothetical protein